MEKFYFQINKEGKLNIVRPGHFVSSGINEKTRLRLEPQHDSKIHKVAQVMLMENNITCFGVCVHHGRNS
jgi:hypothetical protein